MIGGVNKLEKYDFVNGKDDNPYILWKINILMVFNGDLMMVNDDWWLF